MNDLKVMESSLWNLQSHAKRIELSATIARAMCRASLLPEHLRTARKGGVIVPLDAEEIEANCVMIVNQAMRWGVDPFALLSSTFVIHGRLGFDGKLIAAIVNKLAGLRENLAYTFSGSGDDRTVCVTGQFANEHAPRSVTVRVGDAKTENEIWQTDPDQKLVYTGATRWARRHCPEILLGIVTDVDDPATLEAPSAPVAVREAPPAIEQHAPRQHYERALLGANTRAELTASVGSIPENHPELESLKTLARELYGSLPSAISAVADCEAVLVDSQDFDLMKKTFDDLTHLEGVEPIDIKRLGALLNQRASELIEGGA